MTDEYIKKEDLIVGAEYEVQSRNLIKAVWDGEVFVGEAETFGLTYMTEELHWDDNDHYGTVKPLKLIKND